MAKECAACLYPSSQFSTQGQSSLSGGGAPLVGHPTCPKTGASAVLAAHLPLVLACRAGLAAGLAAVQRVAKSEGSGAVAKGALELAGASAALTGAWLRSPIGRSVTDVPHELQVPCVLRILGRVADSIKLLAHLKVQVVLGVVGAVWMLCVQATCA